MSPAPSPHRNRATPPPNPAGTSREWSRTRRIWTSLLLLAFLFVVLMGPVTNPIATEELTAPLARSLAPVHQALFLGHGYRFFAPDPGPSHRVLVRPADPARTEQHFPDRESLWPRLLYHRWFMLSETLWNEHRMLLSESEFNASQAELSAQVERFKLAGKPGLARSMSDLRDRNGRGWNASRKRVKLLTDAVHAEMFRRMGSDGQLLLQQRNIPFAAEVVLGQKLDAPEFLEQPVAVSGPEEIDP